MLGSDLGDFRSHDGCAVALVRVAGVVVMVLFFSDDEVGWLFERGHDGFVVHVAHVGDHGLGRGSLFLSERHDAGPILGSDVVALSVELRGVMHGEEDLEQGLKGDDGRIKLDFNHFSVTGRAGADSFVRGVDDVAAGVRRECGLNAVNLFVGTFNAPEAAAAKNHSLHGPWCRFAHINV